MTYNRFCKILKDKFNVKHKIKMDSDLINDLGLCSFDMMMLVLLLEEETGKEIEMTNLPDNVTVDEILKKIN